MQKFIYLLSLLFITSSVGLAQKATVPDHWKTENGGPYVEAPPDCGGGWYYVYPFNQTPWLDKCDNFVPPTEKIPAGFEMVYGPRPDPNDYRDNIRNWQAAKDLWEQDLKYFGGIVEVNTIVEANTLALVEKTTSAWGLGVPVFVKARYGTIVKFPFATPKVRFETTPDFLVQATHIVVATYQVKVAKELGILPDPRHPFLDGVDLLGKTFYDGDTHQIYIEHWSPQLGWNDQYTTITPWSTEDQILLERSILTYTE